MSDASLINPLNQAPMDIVTSSGSRLEGRLRAAEGASSAGQNGELKRAAQEFEAIFIAHMLKVMRETIEESGLTEGGFGKSIYTELFDQEISLSLAKRGALGISDLLEQRLGNNVDLEEKQKSDSSRSTGTSAKSECSARETYDHSPHSCAQENEISDMQLPVQAPISSRYGMRKDPFTRQLKFHKGLDLAAPEGMAVVPALPGTVLSAKYESGYGNTVLVEHAGGIQTRYGHLSSISVRAGDTITSESILGKVGNTGHSTGSHLHFEVIRDGNPVDPAENITVYRTAYEGRSGW